MSNLCAVGFEPSSNNSTGFSALPAGYYNYGNYVDFGYIAIFWSATVYNGNLAYNRYLYYYYANVYRYNDNKDNGFSVRCVRD